MSLSSRRLAWPLALALALGGACGAGPDDWPEGRPRIDTLEFTGQSRQDPRELSFSLGFADSDGDLGRGVLMLSIDGDPKSEQPLRDLFGAQSPALPLDATTGAIEVNIGLGGGIEPGQQIEVGFSMEDELGRQSNAPSITLEAVE